MAQLVVPVSEALCLDVKRWGQLVAQARVVGVKVLTWQRKNHEALVLCEAEDEATILGFAAEHLDLSPGTVQFYNRG